MVLPSINGNHNEVDYNYEESVLECGKGSRAGEPPFESRSSDNDALIPGNHNANINGNHNEADVWTLLRGLVLNWTG